MKPSRRLFLFRLPVLLLSASLIFPPGCSRVHAPATGPTIPGTVENGVASWYGPGFQGRLTSSREIYDMEGMTAAHRTLPFNTRVLVTNLENGLAVEVRINDRGPFVAGRIIDLSLAAARRIGMVGPGTARVRLRILDSPEARPPSRFAVQAGAFEEEETAAGWAARLRPDYPDVELQSGRVGGRVFFRVRIPARDREEAERIAGELSSRGVSALVLELSLTP
ncbi:MAG: septal ring lytic transglycosylase RlpA family protein [Acidobacteriota bacterium]|nr:septal ring lytic transglycosylase RlpA family protein [Acidobacteriota bacterium]